MKNPTEPVLRTADLIEAAKSRGFTVSDRVLDDWVKAGLLHKPVRKGQGRGKGKVGLWSHNQLELFLLILDRKRAGKVKWIATLCNIPVFMWLTFGDAYASLEQVRKALGTWVGTYKRSSWRKAMYSARQVTRQMDNPQASNADRLALTEAVATIISKGLLKTEDRPELLRALWRVFDPYGERGPVGRAPFQFRPEGWVLLIEARLAAIANYGKLTDEDFERARFIYATTSVRAQAEWARSDKLDLEALGIEGPNLQQMANEACQNLLTILGLEILKPENSPIPRNGPGDAATSRALGTREVTPHANEP